MSARRALALSFLDKYAGLLIITGTTMILARLLTPAEIGIFSITMILVGVLTGLRDMGASAYLIQERELTDDKIKATWTVQLLVGFSLAILVAALAQPVAAFYKEPVMTSVLWILALNFAINPFGSITIAWWTRQMQFQWIALTRFVGALANAGVSIYLAWAGFGVISLAWASLASTLTGIIIITALRPSVLPKLPGIKEIKRVFSFGSRLSGISILNTLSQGLPEALLGRLQDMSQAGFLSRANGLVSLFNRLIMDAVSSVTLPLFSKKIRDGEDLCPTFFRAMSIITGLGWTFFLFLAITALPVMRLLYGDQWDESIYLTQVLCISFGILLPSALSHSILISLGLAQRVLYIATANLVVILSASLTGAIYGMNVLVWLLCFHALISSTVWLIATKKALFFDWKSLASVLLKSLSLAAISSIPVVILSLSIGFQRGAEDWPLLITAALLTLTTFLLASKFTKHPIFEEIMQLYSVTQGRMQ